MKALSAINQLLILSDETLTILNLETLALVKNLKLKNVSCFCLNENPLSEDPFTVEICVASKKRISYVHLNNDQMKIIKEVATFSTPTKMVMDGSHVCFSMGLEYCMLNILSGETQELFGIDSPEQSPIIFRVSKVNIKRIYYWSDRDLYDKSYLRILNIGRISVDGTRWTRSFRTISRIFGETSYKLF